MAKSSKPKRPSRLQKKMAVELVALAAVVCGFQFQSLENGSRVLSVAAYSKSRMSISLLNPMLRIPPRAPCFNGKNRLVDIDLELILDDDTNFSHDQMVVRLKRTRQSKILICRLVSLILAIIGIVNLVPAIHHWSIWANDEISYSPPIWIFILIFIAFIFLIYACFLYSIANCSALQSISITMLVLVAVFSFVAVGLMLGGTSGAIARQFGIHVDLFDGATVWNLVMLVISMLVCYLSAREAIHWRRVEVLAAAAKITDQP